MRPVATAPVDLEALQERIRLAPGQLVASRIKRARKTMDPQPRGLSHDDFGRLVGTSRQHLIKLEKAQHRPGAEMLLRISEASGRSVDWFLDPEVDPRPFPDGDGA
jgi:transcriptional regulator with XRE-family HTH domain